MPSEKSQTRNSIYYKIPFTHNSRKCKLIYSERGRSVIAWEQVEGHGEVGGKKYKEAQKTFQGDGYIHYFHHSYSFSD